MIIKAMYNLNYGTFFMRSDGALRNYLISLGKKLLGDRFKYLGVVPFDKLPLYYSNADVCVMVSRNEPYGAVVLESMACGTPVVVERDKTREWMIGDGGFLINDASNVDALADAINYVYYGDWSKKAREQAEKFSWEKTVQGYEEALEEVI